MLVGIADSLAKEPERNGHHSRSRQSTSVPQRPDNVNSKIRVLFGQPLRNTEVGRNPDNRRQDSVQYQKLEITNACHLDCHKIS